MMVNRLINKVDAVISVSNFTKQMFLKWTDLDDNIVKILPNSFDQSLFGLGPKNRELLSRYNLYGKKVLMTFGRLCSEERYKGFDEILALLPKLTKEIPDLAYLIVGDGQDRERLKNIAQSLGVGDKVIFAGYIPDSEKADHYRLADVFVMPSRGEGFGIVFLEAMACGIPVIGSNVDGSREALREGKLGIIVNPNDPKEIYNGILSALGKSKAIAEELDYFSFSNFQKRVQQILNQLIS